MRDAITKEFGDHRPRAIVLDDNANARRSTARRLTRRGFEVVACKDVDEFRAAWSPGMADVIVSDWDLSNAPDEKGDRILEWVRHRDWDVPFVLISGKLGEADERAGVMENLLLSGGAAYVTRGGSGKQSAISEACDLAQDLIERRDLALLKIILALRGSAEADESIAVSSGRVKARDLLATLVSKPHTSRDAGRPVATARRKRVTGA